MGLDCSARGTVDVGFREPDDETERRLFRELFYRKNRARPNVRVLLDFQQLQDEHGYDPDELEEQLIAWSLDRLITFSSSRRLRRVRLLSARASQQSLERESARWKRWQQRRLQAIIDYATEESCCRRVIVARHFGDTVGDCTTRGIVPCDHCSRDQRPWALLPDHLVADPELLVNAELTVLQAVAWSSAYRKGFYGESSLRAAVLGKDSLGEGRPLGSGVLACPQFGTLRHVRNGQKRWDDSVDKLLRKGLIERKTVQRENSRNPYQSLVLAPVGAQTLGIAMKNDD